MSTDGATRTPLEQENDSLRLRVAELEQAALNVELLLSMMNDFVMVIDAEGHYLEIWPTKAADPQLTATTIGHNVRQYLVPDVADRFIQAIQRAIATGQEEHIEYPIEMSSGEMWTAATMRPLAGARVLVFARDITAERRVQRAEREQLELKDQIIQAQQAALRELSTPLVPLADGVIAMPLVGALDSARAQEVMEKLLDGIVRLQARTVILDITGIKTVDTQAADAMLRVARATKLLGAQLILTGIAPEVAQTLVELGADLGGIVTQGNLQTGIAYALRTAGGARNGP